MSLYSNLKPREIAQPERVQQSRTHTNPHASLHPRQLRLIHCDDLGFGVLSEAKNKTVNNAFKLLG